MRDLGLPEFINRLTPIVEATFETPVDAPGERTTGTINPGVIWTGRRFQVGAEAVIPINRDSGHGVGFVVQLHLFLDDLFPGSLGRTDLVGRTPCEECFSTLSAAFALAAGQAHAHAMLEHALPRVGAVVRAAPTELRLWFSERVELALSRVTLATAAGRPVAIGALALAPGDGRQVTAAVPAALPPGAYRVRWRVVSVDSHRPRVTSPSW